MIQPGGKSLFLPAAALVLLLLLNGCCVLTTVQQETWCLTEHRLDDRETQYCPEKQLLTVEGNETKRAYFFPFDYYRKIPWTTVRHYQADYRLNQPPPKSLITCWEIRETQDARRFKTGRGLPCLQIRIPQYLEAYRIWGGNEKYIEHFNKTEELQIHPEDRKYLSGPFMIEDRKTGFLLIPCGKKEGQYLFYTPKENDLFMREKWTEQHSAVVWRAVWIIPAVVVDLVFWPVEFLWVGLHDGI